MPVNCFWWVVWSCFQAWELSPMKTILSHFKRREWLKLVLFLDCISICKWHELILPCGVTFTASGKWGLKISVSDFFWVMEGGEWGGLEQVHRLPDIFKLCVLNISYLCVSLSSIWRIAFVVLLLFILQLLCCCCSFLATCESVQQDLFIRETDHPAWQNVSLWALFRSCLSYSVHFYLFCFEIFCSLFILCPETRFEGPTVCHGKRQILGVSPNHQS